MTARRRMMFVAALWVAMAGLAGCHLWYQDMKGFLEYWTETVTVGGLAWSATETQRDSGGADTIPTNASVTASVSIDNPDNYPLDCGVGSAADTLRSVRIAGASGSSVLPLASVVDGGATGITLSIGPVSSVPTPASRALEHTDFTVTFIPTRTDNGQSTPAPQTLSLRYNTPPRMPVEVAWSSAEQRLGWLGAEHTNGWEMVQAAGNGLDDHIYWAWPRDKTAAGGCDPADPDYAAEFHVHVDGVHTQTVAASDVATSISPHVSPMLADYNVYRVAASSGTRIAVYALDGEGVRSRAAGSGAAPHKIVLDAGSGFFASSGGGSVELYKADKSLVSGGDLETPYYAGHYLSGWTRDGGPVTFPLEMDAPMTLTARWEANPPASTGGSGTGSGGGTSGTGTGGSTGTGAGGGTSTGTGGAGSIPATYTVTYDKNNADGGTAPASQIKVAGKPLSLAANTGSLARTGYTFTGWNTKPDGGGTGYAEGAAYTQDADLTLYAQWTAWGTVAPVTISPSTGDADAVHPLTVTLSTATTGAEIRYTMDGTDPATGSTAQVGSSPVSVTVSGAAQIRAVATAPNMHTSTETKASYSLKEYTVSLDNQGGSGDSQIAGVCHGASRASVTVPTRTGYSFGGYWTGQNGQGTQYYNASGSGVGQWDMTSPATTLYAQWTANTYTVTFDAAGGSGGNGSVTVTYDQTPSKVTAPTKAGYTFGGYWTQQNGQGTQYYDKDGNGVRTWQETSATTLYAQWTANKYTVQFQGGTGGMGSMTAQQFTYDQPQSLTTNGFTRTGYAFDGWKGSDGKDYTDGQSNVSNLTTADGGTITLTAQWKANTYTVKFNNNGVEAGSMADQQFTYDAAQSLTTNGFSRSGYTFAGWKGSDGKDYTDGQSVENLTADPNGTVTLTAQWIVKLTGDAATIEQRIGTMTDAGTFTVEVTMTGAMTTDNVLKIRDALLALKTSAPGAQARLDLSGVTGLTELPDYAFNPANSNTNPASNLKEVILPNTVTNIGWVAFDCCTSLTYVDFGSGVTNIEGQAFDWTGSLTTIRVSAPTPPTFVSGTNGSNDSFTKSSITTIQVPSAYLSAYQSSDWANITTQAGQVTIVGY